MTRLLALPVALALMAAGAGVYAAQAPMAGRGAPADSFPAASRPVAPIVSPTWGDIGQRDSAHEVEQIAERLHLKPGDTVADIGAGRGYDTLRLARRLQPRGRVIAEDVDPSALQALSAEAERRHLSNVVIALGEPQDPRLPARSLNAAVLVHMYHEIAHPYAFLFNLAAALKPGARVGVEELDRPTQAHGTPPALLRCEFAAVGYRLEALKPLDGGLGYFAVFAAPDQPPEPQRIRACHA
jgi:SAM-dependent methyltransferase